LRKREFKRVFDGAKITAAGVFLAGFRL